MPHTKSAAKSTKKNEIRRLRNRSVRRSVKTLVSKAINLIQRGDGEEARTTVIHAQQALDKAAQKGILRDNSVARRKSQLMKKFSAAFPSNN